MLNKIPLFLLLIFVSLHTFAADKTPPKVEQKPKQEQPQQPLKTSQIPADYYQKIGMPPITKPWGPNDYLQAAAVLATVAQRNAAYLPHYEDSIADPYMRHIVNGQNLYQVLQFANSRQQRIDLILLYLDGIQRMLSIYQQVLSKTAPYYAEWLDLIALSSYLAALSAPELQYPMSTQNSGIPGSQQADAYAAKREAAGIMQTAMVNPVITGLQAIPRLSPVLAWRLVEKLNYSMPTYAQLLPLSSQQQIYAALLAALQQVQDPQLRTGIQNLAALFNTPR
jgi:hypothetical protein